MHSTDDLMYAEAYKSHMILQCNELSEQRRVYHEDVFNKCAEEITIHHPLFYTDFSMMELLVCAAVESPETFLRDNFIGG